MVTSAPLTAAELKAQEPFRKAELQQQQTSSDEPMDFAVEILRMSKKPRGSERSLSDYVPLLVTIPLTINRCERLFFECKYVLSRHRTSMHQANFEMIMFLEANRDLWKAA